MGNQLNYDREEISERCIALILLLLQTLNRKKGGRNVRPPFAIGLLSIHGLLRCIALALVGMAVQGDGAALVGNHPENTGKG